MDRNEMMLKIMQASNVLYNKIENDENRIKIGLEASELYKSLNKQEKEKIALHIYIIYRELGALYFRTNTELYNAEFFFESSLNIKEENRNKDIESLKNECITKQMLAKTKMLIHLNNYDEKRLQEAYSCIEFLKENYDEKWDEDFKKRINNVIEIYNGIMRKDVKSIVTFKVQYHLLIDDNE